MEKLIPSYKGTCFYPPPPAEKTLFAVMISHQFAQQHQDRGEPEGRQVERYLAGSVSRVCDF